jgi:hypothetical protein
MCMFCRSLFVLFLLAIVLSVLLRYTDSDYPVGIFKHLLLDLVTWRLILYRPIFLPNKFYDGILLMGCNFKFEGVLFRSDSRHNDIADSLRDFKFEDWKLAIQLFKEYSYLYKVDLRSGYHHFDICPQQQTYLGFSSNRKYFCFTVLVFGLFVKSLFIY